MIYNIINIKRAKIGWILFCLFGYFVVFLTIIEYKNNTDAWWTIPCITMGIFLAIICSIMIVSLFRPYFIETKEDGIIINNYTGLEDSFKYGKFIPYTDLDKITIMKNHNRMKVYAIFSKKDKSIYINREIEKFEQFKKELKDYIEFH